MKVKVLLLMLISLFVGLLGYEIGLNPKQSIAISIFSASILGTLFFWEFRLSFVFVGSGILLLAKVIDLENFIKFASLDVILFLIGMMIVISMLKEAGFFMWLISRVLRVKNLTGRKLFIILMFISSLLSGLMDEVTSIITMVTVILEISDFLDVNPVPLLISSVFATNIGSAQTVLGNPIGVLIAARGKLSFEDFLINALPVSLVVLVITTFLLLIWYRDYIKDISKKLKGHNENKFFLQLISVPSDRKTKISMIIFGITVLLIGLHRRLELLFGVEENTLLILLPIISAGLVMVYRHDKARYYVEHEVEWNALLFFLFLFAQAGVIQASGIGSFIAEKIVSLIGNHPNILSFVVLFSSGFLSGTLDNVVVVSSYIPVIKSLSALHVSLTPLWWALLFGACYGGNITIIGSTANIVAMGILEKQKNIKINFFEWFKIGLIVGILSMAISYLAIIFTQV
ncbi:MAG: hypothetical protein COY53_03500 [Elusimicrobia bacterium CG_4_10_14_0_8_um_filter_37_32]|nr:MAG: hypothetical protein COS17_07980 [Elusimicrobia bacterium CG02_land_8_20_14_3_00_37_13]PIZ13691.1 MAG: hypothetical protein COY53_03500 [Elusimicrobia bacterium CG_4_10_14_0_8_um_filter_37_32]